MTVIRIVRGVVVSSIATGSMACMGAAGEPAQRSPATRAATSASAGRTARSIESTCELSSDRPSAGEAATEEGPYGDETQVRYAATPPDAPCETLDIRFRMRDGMLIGKPDSQVELVWSAERAVADDTELGLLVGTTTVPLPSRLRRLGSRFELSARAPADLVARCGIEDRPTFVVSDRRIELSPRQTTELRTFLQRLPPGSGIGAGRGSSGNEVLGRRPPVGTEPVAADPESGRGWFCVEAANGADPKNWISACHRTRAECEESRASIRTTEKRVGDCAPSPAAVCYSWRRGTGRARSCFYRPSQCQRHEAMRREEEPRTARTAPCLREP